jgi:hypothetical protein
MPSCRLAALSAQQVELQRALAQMQSISADDMWLAGMHTSAYVSIRQDTSAHVSIRMLAQMQSTSADDMRLAGMLTYADVC